MSTGVRAAGLTLLFALTLFTSASLVFVVEPMFGKMALPLLGGTPSVWNTCMVFYQAVLLAGYAYAHLLSTRLRLELQVAVHTSLLLIAAMALPVAMPPDWTPPVDRSPIPSLLMALLAGVGAPLLVLSATAPLLQKWFSLTDSESATDPYFLYASSNVGSILALVAYPLIIEPSTPLRAQSTRWSAVYGLLVLLTAACGIAARVRRRASDNLPTVTTGGISVSWQRRARWFALSFVPSSLMLAVTTYLSTDVGSVPLLWTIPLALYLLSFILGFATWRVVPPSVTRITASGALVILAFVFATGINRPLLVMLGLHLAVLFLVALSLHSDLADDRPEPDRLTEFYLWIAVGGVAGGLFNTLAAPLLFTSVAEYPLALAAAAWLMRRLGGATRPTARDLTAAIIAGGAAAGLVVLFRRSGPPSLALAPLLAIACTALLVSARTTISFGLAVSLVLASGLVSRPDSGDLMYARRTFFGVLRVWNVAEERQHRIAHGTTIHGVQSTASGHTGAALSYYHPDGPIGQVFSALRHRLTTARVAVIGLGAGGLAAYAQPQQRWTFYEIDPEVERIARNPRFFTFLRDCGVQCEVRLGDARLRLTHDAARYDLLVVDAFSSDAIPVHLMTREAMALYIDRLTDGGVLVFHISNRHLRLRSLVAGLARDGRLTGRAQFYRNGTTTMVRTPSHWVAMARREIDLGSLASDRRWTKLEPDPGTRIWSDDFSDVVSVLNLR
jgi:hypothetical protein